MDDWTNKKSNMLISWYMRVSRVNYEDAKILLDWVNENNIMLDESNKNKLEDITKI